MMCLSCAAGDSEVDHERLEQRGNPNKTERSDDDEVFVLLVIMT